VLGDRQPLSRRIVVSGGGEPKLSLVARPDAVVRGLAPPGARSWSAALARRPLPADALLKRLIETRMELVRSDQFQGFLSNPDQLGVNVACLEGVSPFDFAEVVVFDGQRHPGDNPEHKTYTAGVLRFEPASGD